jgi:dihydroxy-acid dehydratase
VPEARLGGPIALVRDGDRVVIDSEKRTIDWNVSEEEQARRRVEWEGSGKGTLTVKRGILLRYARDVAVRGVFSLSQLLWHEFRADNE